MADTILRKRGRKRKADEVLERRMRVSEKRLRGMRNMTKIAEIESVSVATISRDWAWLDEHYSNVAAENIAVEKGKFISAHELLLNKWMPIVLDVGRPLADDEVLNEEAIEKRVADKIKATRLIQNSLKQLADACGFAERQEEKTQGLDLMRQLARMAIDAEKAENERKAAKDEPRH